MLEVADSLVRICGERGSHCVFFGFAFLSEYHCAGSTRYFRERRLCSFPQAGQWNVVRLVAVAVGVLNTVGVGDQDGGALCDSIDRPN